MSLARQLRRWIVGAAGSIVLLLGVLMIVLPGPAIVLIPLGLGILALEFPWARKLWERLSSLFKKKT